jgi:hypothetical protein
MYLETPGFGYSRLSKYRKRRRWASVGTERRSGRRWGGEVDEVGRGGKKTVFGGGGGLCVMGSPSLV